MTVFSAVLTSWLNSRLVERIGTRRLAHTGLVLFTLVAALHLGLDRLGGVLWLFVALQGVNMACFGLASANFGALAMQPLGHAAGTASSVQGTIGTICGALIGIVIGQSFDGSLLPLETGFVLLGAAALAIIVLTERGRLFAAG